MCCICAVRCTLLPPAFDSNTTSAQQNCVCARANKACAVGAHSVWAARNGLQAAVPEEREASSLLDKRGVSDRPAISSSQHNLSHLDHIDLLNLQKHVCGWFVGGGRR